MATRFLIKVDNPREIHYLNGREWENKSGSQSLKELQERQGHLAFFDTEITKL